MSPHTLFERLREEKVSLSVEVTRFNINPICDGGRYVHMISDVEGYE